MDNEPIHCVFSTDKNYCPHLAVVLASLLDTNRQNALFLHIVHQDVGEENLAKLRQVLEKNGASFSFYNFKAENFSHLYVSGYISLASYFRLFLTDILPKDVDRIVYIDADIVVLDDIAPLAKTEMKGSIAAVADPFPGDSSERLGIPGKHIYFNAGVLILDLDKWRAVNMRDRFVAYIEKHSSGLKFHDQDALNALLYDEVTYLDLRWNFQPRADYQHVAFLDLTRAQFDQIAASPAIVHFTSYRKPWLYKYDIPFETEYLAYREQTPWGGFRQPDKTATQQVVRTLRRKAPSLFKLINSIGWRARKFLAPTPKTEQA